MIFSVDIFFRPGLLNLTKCSCAWDLISLLPKGHTSWFLACGCHSSWWLGVLRLDGVCSELWLWELGTVIQ